MNYDVFFYECFKEEEELIKKYLPKDVKAGFFQDTIQESDTSEPPAKIISVRAQSKVPQKWTEDLSAIISRTTGYDHLSSYSRKVLCGYLPEYCIRAVAEQAIMLCLILLRKLPRQIKQFLEFDRNNLTGSEAKGKKVLIVGVGKIGHEIHDITKKFDMQSMGVDLVKIYPDVNYVSIEKGLVEADIIICSMNLTKKNKGYFNYDLLKKAKTGAIFINVSRGELSPSGDLLKLIDEGHLGGVALDVYDNESILAQALRSKDKIEDEEIKDTIELGKKENVIFTPHNAFNTYEALERKSFQTVEQLKHFMETKKFIWQAPEGLE